MFGMYVSMSNGAMIAAIVFSLVAAVILAIAFAPAKKKAELTGFGARLNDLFNFRDLFIEKILKFLYILATCFCIIAGLFGLLTAIFRGYGFASCLSAFLFMVLGPVVLRLAFELLMMMVLLVTNVIEINKKLDGTPEKAPEPEACQPAAEPRYVYCTQCGTKFDETLENCPNCGRR